MNYSDNEDHTEDEKEEDGEHQNGSKNKQGGARPIEKSDRLYSEYLNAFCPEY